MAANKVVFGEKVIMDLTGDSVSPENLLAGETAHDRAGNPITGAVITHDVVDNLESTSTEDALSANQGRELKEMMSDVPHREDDEDTEIEVPNIDADMLDGHPSDYYAKQSDLSVLNTSVTQLNNKIGNTDVSKWGNSLTGAIKSACDKADANETAIADVNSNLPTFCNSDNITNLNNAKSDKTYSGIAYKGATNYPDTESNFCLVTSFSAYTDVFGVQFAHTDISDIYSRSVQNGVWTNWKKLNN